MARILIVDCAPPESADEFSELGLPHMWEVERRMLSGLDHELDFEVAFAADTGAGLPDRHGISEFDGMLWSGTPLSVTNDSLEVRRQLELMSEAFASGVPIFGICGGLQVAAVVAGGCVEKSPAGLESPVARDVTLTEAGARHPMFERRAMVFDAVCDHEDVVTKVPDGATVLAGNGHAAVQAMVLPTAGSEFWGVQYHPDFSVDYLEAIAGYRGEEWIKLGWLEDATHLAYFVRSFRRLREGDTAAGWSVGVGADILSDGARLAEVEAWLRNKVLIPRGGEDGES